MYGVLPGTRAEKMRQSGIEMPKIFVKDIKDIRNSLDPVVVPQTVNIHCVAIHKEVERNHELRINLHRSIPITGYVYNNVTDKYAVLCYDHIELGGINVAYKVSMGGVGNWHAYIPMPEAVLKRYMTSDQRRMLAHFKAAFREQNQEVRYEYIQMLSAYPYG